MDEVSYSLKNVAKIFGVTTKTLVRWEKGNKIPLFKRMGVNNRRVATDQDIDQIKAIIKGCRTMS